MNSPNTSDPLVVPVITVVVETVCIDLGEPMDFAFTCKLETCKHLPLTEIIDERDDVYGPYAIEDAPLHHFHSTFCNSMGTELCLVYGGGV